MPLHKKELSELLEYGVRLAVEAGKITTDYFRRLSPETIDRKRDGSFVTAADREAERYLRSSLEKDPPDDGILGEEEGERTGRSNRRWIIDPIDGTYSFVHGVPLYGVLIGFEENTEEDSPVIGIVNIPATGDLVYAARGLGCFWNGNPARVSSVSRLEDALLLSTDFGTCDRYGFGEASRTLEKSVAHRRSWGDCYGHVLVATGRAEIMLDPVMNIWDCAALMPILLEAGGTFTDWFGRPTINGGNAISTNSYLLDSVTSITRRELTRDSN